VTTLGKLAVAAATITMVAAAAGCSDDSSSSADPAPSATVTVTQAPSAEATSPSTEATASAAAEEPPATYAEALARIEAAQDVTGGGAEELGSFTTPSGNIFCALNLDQLPAGCELREGAVPAPDVCADAPTPAVGRIELQGGRAVPVCNTDTIVQPGAPVLRYGQAAYTRDTACVSEEIGVTCVSRSGSGGFFLHRGAYVLLD
jgi:hypothetical protein